VEYLYKALKRDVGVAEPEPSSVLPIEEQLSEPVAVSVEKRTKPVDVAAKTSYTVAPAPARYGKAVPFPVNTERLYALRSDIMGKERVHALEQYRVLRSRVLEMMRMQKMRTLMVTSAVSGECKTTTSINLALAISQVQGIKVLLVDADLRKAGIAEVLGIPYQHGLHDYLHSAVPFSEVFLQLTDSLSLVPSGGTDQSSAELLHSAEMVAFVKQVASSFDIVIFDAPPLFPVADARITANLVEAVLFCVRAGATSETIVSEAVTLIRSKLIGTVLAGAEVRPGGWYYYYSDSYAKE
jgi:capsular exopolysaccharide synthesis family protein